MFSDPIGFTIDFMCIESYVGDDSHICQLFLQYLNQINGLTMKSFFYYVFILFIAGAWAYYYFLLDNPQNQAPQVVTKESLPIPTEAEPEIKHPITEAPVVIGSSTEEMPAETETKTETEEPLPALEESDDRIKEILSEFIGNDLVSKIFQQRGIIHRFVVTIDSLPMKEVPIRYRLPPPTAGKFLVQKQSDEVFTIDTENYARYNTYVQLLDKLDTAQFIKWYMHFYPLIQEDYDSFGYKNGYFNDRFVFVIDHLLETPEVIGSIKLVQPHVFYKFADPALKKLSAGQKILLRIGPANTAIVKAKLVKIRKLLVAPQVE